MTILSITKNTLTSAAPAAHRAPATVSLTSHPNFRPIAGYQDLYAVGPCGRVWSYRNQRFLKPGVMNQGYAVVTLSKSGHSKKYLVHRLVADAFLPADPTRPIVDHVNGIKTDSRLANLQRVDQKTNMLRAQLLGLIPVAKLKFTTPRAVPAHRLAEPPRKGCYHYPARATAGPRTTHPSSMPVQIVAGDGQVYGTYPSIREAARQWAVSEDALTQALNRGTWCHATNSYWRRAAKLHVTFRQPLVPQAA